MALLRTIERGFDNVNRTHLVMASGKLALQKSKKESMSIGYIVGPRTVGLA